jgi:hypothetical protein
LRLLWAVPCRSATIGPGGADIEGAGVNNVWVPSLPAELSFTILLGLGSVPEYPEGELELHLLGPGLDPLQSLDTTIAAAPTPDWEEGSEIVGLVPVVLRFDANNPGNHSVEIYIDGKHRQSIFFVVRVGTPPGGP